MIRKQHKKTPILPKQKRSIRSKETILKAAGKVFAQKGLHGARIDVIAEQAKINKQRIYAYFGPKKNLYRQVLLDVYSQAADNEKLMALTEKDIPNMTRIILDSFFEFHANHPLFWRLLAWENLNGGKSLNSGDWSHIKAAYINHLEQLYKAGQKSGVFKTNVDFPTYLMAVFALTYFYHSNQLTVSHLLDLNLTSKQVQTTITDQIDFMITRGIAE